MFKLVKKDEKSIPTVLICIRFEHTCPMVEILSRLFCQTGEFAESKEGNFLPASLPAGLGIAICRRRPVGLFS